MTRECRNKQFSNVFVSKKSLKNANFVWKIRFVPFVFSTTVPNHYFLMRFRYPKEPLSQPIMNRPSNHVDKVIPSRRPPAPPVRIDTCIVGDDSTCEIDKHEICRTHLGVSSCDCKPGYGRVNHRKACKSKSRLFIAFLVESAKDLNFMLG